VFADDRGPLFVDIREIYRLSRVGRAAGTRSPVHDSRSRRKDQPTMPTPTRTFPRLPSRTVAALLACLTLVVPLTGSGFVAASPSHPAGPRPTIVLVHGDWADGSSWDAVVARLQARGFTVLAPPNPLRAPTSDAAYLASFLQTISGPIVLAGHSYGGFVITNAARGNTNVKALVYVDAFIPEAGQVLAELTVGSCLDPATAFKAVPVAGDVDLYLRPEANPPYPGFAECFANGVNRRDAAVLTATQRPAAASQLGEPSGPPAWATIPAWALIGTADRVITPAQQRTMAEHAGARISTVNAGHLSLITRPEAVTKFIVAASDATS
jgi:pimeloyl-ACP methyl ester carboxylesterase